MNIPSREAWLIVAVVSAVSAGVSAALLAISVAEDNLINMALSAAAFILFIGCFFVALSARSKLARLNRSEVEVKYLKLKKPGIERREEEDIVPKGKKPKE
jgi:predicted lysophospholipase L1 biosynthesis ABC-type transport system permease subunit